MQRSSKRWFDNPFPDWDTNTMQIQANSGPLKEYGLELLTTALAKGGSSGDGSVYVGSAGVAYALLHVHPFLTAEERTRLYPLAFTAMQNQMKYYMTHDKAKTDECAFLLGRAGYYAVGAVFGKTFGDENYSHECIMKFVQAAQVCKPVAFFKHGGDELLVGRAGYLCGALWLNQKLGYMPVPIQDLRDIWNAVIESGKAYSQKHKSACPLMYSYYDTEYLGAAHGVSGIIQMLLGFPIFLKENPEAEKMIKSTLNYYLSLQDAAGNFPCAMDEVGPSRRRGEADMLVHWCHGAPGAVYMFAKAYLHYGERKYLDACLRSGDVVWQRGLLRKGPGICHGIAGNGYVFLLIYNLLERKDPKHLYRAVKFAEFLQHPEFQQAARRPDCPFSLYEGIAGTACYVMDLIQPGTAEFPFFNVNFSVEG